MMQPEDLDRAFASVLQDINTSLPGVVVSYDGRRAVCKPSIDKLSPDGRITAAPQIVSVPVVWPTAANGSARISLPLQPGDGVMLHFSQRSLEAWSDAGDSLPDSPRMFHMTDAVAVPGLFHDAVPITADTTNLCIQFGNAYIKITPGGVLQIHAPGGVTLTGSAMTSDAEITALGIKLSQHEHTDNGQGVPTSAPIAGT